MAFKKFTLQWRLGSAKLLIFCAILMASPLYAAPLSPTATEPSKIAAPDNADKTAGDENINRFINTIDVIKKEYALPVNDKKLLENAIRGMVANLDPHSEYLDEDAYRSLLTSTSGAFGGIGIEVTSAFGVLKIITPIDDTPAAKAGLKPGDFIVALNNKLVNEMTSDEAVTEMRGPKGSALILTVIRKGEKDPLKFTIIRDTIHIDSLKSKMLVDNIGYIRISQFQEATGNLLIQAIAKLKDQAKDKKLKGLILDLRNNPGGLLESAVDVVNVFLNSATLTKFDKMIVYTQGRVPDSEYKARATGKDLLDGAPLILLINDGSASASEIVAGALQDYQRAIIVGETSFGKGSVQTVLPLDKTHAVKLTTALYHTPSGRIIQNQGITPDVAVANIKVANSKDDSDIDPIREMGLKDHLLNPNTANPAIIASQTDLAKVAKQDFQLYEAINILETASLMHAQK